MKVACVEVIYSVLMCRLLSLSLSCGSLYQVYCSTRCQKVDWKTGGHREDCKKFQKVKKNKVKSGGVADGAMDKAIRDRQRITEMLAEAAARERAEEAATREKAEMAMWEKAAKR